jgi:hypothetical protein
MSVCFLHLVENARRVAGVQDLVRCCGDPVIDSPHRLFLDQHWQATRGEVSLLVAEGRRTNLFNFPKVGSTTLGALQLHIHVMPDSKVRW